MGLIAGPVSYLAAHVPGVAACRMRFDQQHQEVVNLCYLFRIMINDFVEISGGWVRLRERPIGAG